MNDSPVISIAEARRRASRVAHAIDARRRLRAAPARRRGRTGRMWLNGVQLGRAQAGLGHLTESYD